MTTHNKFILVFTLLFLFACQQQKIAQRFPSPQTSSNFTGTHFFDIAKSFNWQQRDSLAILWFRNGKIPSFWKKFSRIDHIEMNASGKRFKISYWVSPDYFVVGTNDDWVRVPITPMAAQQIMDEVDCSLPTRKMVDQIYLEATTKLAPVPMFAYRDSSVTMYQHHLMTEGQRKGKKGLIAGIKKDVVTTYKIQYGPKANRVAIYGWHQINGKAIQPLYAGHVNWYVDYSHGIRFISNKMKVNGKWTDYKAVLKDQALNSLICDEDTCGYYRY